MANEEHVAQLRMGTTSWNAWRRETPDIRPDLSGADLFEANLGGAHLSGASLWWAILRRAALLPGV
jgi:hypothetical protein